MKDLFKQGETQVEDLRSQVEKALQLLDTETADAIIGSETEEYQTLIQGGQSLGTMLWAMMKQHGLRQNGRSLKHQAQFMAMLLTLIHYAYALGMRRGREEADGG
jgi:hypothetical protein